MMKLRKFTALVLTGLMVLSLAACGQKSPVELKRPAYPEYNALEYVDLTDDYKDVHVAVAPKTEVSDELVDMQIRTYMQDTIGYEKFQDKPVTEDAILEVSYVGEVDGKVDDDLSSNGHRSLYMTDKTVPPEFKEALLTMKVGESKNVTLTFPDDYEKENYHGVTATYNLTLHYVMEEPAVTDESVAKASKGDFKTVSELREHFKKIDDEKYETIYQNNIVKLVIDEASKSGTVNKVPDELIDWCVGTQMYINEQTAKLNGQSLDEYLKLNFSQTREEAEASVRKNAPEMLHTELVMRAIAEKEDLQLTDDVYQEKAQKMVFANGCESIEDLEKQFGRDVVEDSILMEVIMDWLVDHATVTETK